MSCREGGGGAIPLSFACGLAYFFAGNQRAKSTSKLALLVALPGVTTVTWLILPVVICLSQRLSHACLSINHFIRWNCEWLITSVIVYLILLYYLDNRSNSRANTCTKSRLLEGMYLLDTKPSWGQPQSWWFIITLRIAWLYAGDASFKFLPYQLSMVRYWLTMVTTGNGELGFDSGEGAWEMATTSKEGSRRANYPILTQGGSDNK